MSLPADYSTCPPQRRRQPLADRPEPGPDLRGVLHDVGHGLFTLSLLLDTAADTVRPQLGDDAFELVVAEVAALLGAVNSGMRRSPHPVPVELRGLLDPFPVIARRTTLTRVTLRPGPPVVVRADPGVVWRAVSNLVDNAVRAAGPLGNVRIDVDGDGGRAAWIDVEDDGPGFQQGPSGISGLGLPVVNRLLDGAGGRLQIDDVRPHGTRMRVVLPVGGGLHELERPGLIDPGPIGPGPIVRGPIETGPIERVAS